MSATLPPLANPPKGPDFSQPDHMADLPPGLPNRLAPIKKVLSKREKDMLLRLQVLRQQQPYLTKPETAVYRNSYIHTLYLDMLQEGYHKSFSELFALIRQQKDERERAGPDSVLWNQILLENEPDKLDELKKNLTKAEAAGREEKFLEIYDAQFALARYFLTTGDKWLSDHFFACCLQTCLTAPEEKRKMAEAYCNMGLAVEEAGDRHQAASHFESFHEIAQGQEWESDDGVILHHLACTHLSRIYTSIADTLDTDMAQCVEYLLKAHEMAKESTNKKLEGEASYRLGLGYEKNKDYEKALYFLKRYFDVCQVLDDHHGLGLACEAIARSYERQGKVQECIRHLEMFVNVAEKSGLEKDVSRACSDLGAVFNSLSRYEEAAEYFTKAYNISRSLNDKEAISSSRVQYGIAIAHRMLGNVSVHVERESKPCTKRIIEWKNARQDAFDKPIPGDGQPESRQTSAEPPTSKTPSSASQAKTPDPNTTPSPAPTTTPQQTTPAPATSSPAPAPPQSATPSQS